MSNRMIDDFGVNRRQYQYSTSESSCKDGIAPDDGHYATIHCGESTGPEEQCTTINGTSTAMTKSG